MAEKSDKEQKEAVASTQEKQKAPKEKSKDQGEKKATPQKKEAKAPSSIIRLAGRDVNGGLSLVRALDQVKGIGSDMAHALAFSIETKLNISGKTTLGALSEDQIEQVEKAIKNPAQYGVPLYMLNRRKDAETGKDVHLVSNELIFATRQDVSRDVALRTWRGFRHQYGQKVRGQHTRSTGRTGTTVGVMKKTELAKAQPAKAGEAKEAAAPKKEEKKA